jgi:hypothetical protein
MQKLGVNPPFLKKKIYFEDWAGLCYFWKKIHTTETKINTFTALFYRF